MELENTWYFVILVFMMHVMDHGVVQNVIVFIQNIRMNFLQVNQIKNLQNNYGNYMEAKRQ